MRTALPAPIFRALALTLSLSLAGTLGLPAAAQAAFIPAAPSTPGTELDAVQAALENDLLRERLEALGVPAEEVRARLSSLTPEERTAAASQLHTLQSGGEVTWSVTITGDVMVDGGVFMVAAFIWMLWMVFTAMFGE